MRRYAAILREADDPVSRGLTKPVQSLPGAAGEQASAMWAGAVAAPRRDEVCPDPSTASGSATNRTVDPWAVVAGRGRWYLLCFDPAAVEQHLGAGRRYPTQVRFEAPLARVRPFISPVMGSLQPLAGDTACLLRGTTDNPQTYAGE